MCKYARTQKEENKRNFWIWVPGSFYFLASHIPTLKAGKTKTYRSPVEGKR